MLIKSAVDPASLTDSDWAKPLAAAAVADMITNLGPVSAGAQLLKLGLQFTFGNVAAINVPGIVASADNAGFVQEGAPIPARALEVHPAVLEPRKFASISVFNREIFEHSVPAIELLVRTTMAESIGLALDTALFDATAGDAIRPAGLLNAVSPITASTSATVYEALIEDVSALAAAVASVAANGPIIFVASPEQAVVMRMWANQLSYSVFASGALTDGTVIAVAPNALCSATDPIPRFNAVKEAVLHMEDATPLQIGGTTTPVRSLYQTNAIGLRVVMEVAWALRATGAVAFIADASW